MKKAIVCLFAILFANLSAAELSFWGGLQKVKDEGLNNFSMHLKSTQPGFADAFELNLAKNSFMSITSGENLFGWQFGESNSNIGAFRIFPLGLLVSAYDKDEKIFIFSYKAALQYQKDCFLAQNLSFKASLGYVNTLFGYSSKVAGGAPKVQIECKPGAGGKGFVCETDTDKIIDAIKDKFDKRKPRGFDINIGFDYMLSKWFLLGMKFGWANVKDGTLQIKDGLNAKLGFGFKF